MTYLPVDLIQVDSKLEVEILGFFHKGVSVLKTGILGNCVFAKFSKNIKHLTFGGCQSKIPLNYSQSLFGELVIIKLINFLR